jgi:hypothetical protein
LLTLHCAFVRATRAIKTVAVNKMRINVSIATLKAGNKKEIIKKVGTVIKICHMLSDRAIKDQETD